MQETTNYWAQIDENPSPATFISFLDRLNSMYSVRSYKQRTLDLLHALPGDHILDIGCGTGEDARSLAQVVGEGGRIVGVDKSAIMVAEAQKRNKSTGLSATFEEGDAQNLAHSDNSFDRCRADRVLQHVEDPSQALAEMLRVCKPGGRVAVSEPDWGTLIIDSTDTKTTRLIINGICDGVKNGWIGRRLPHMLSAVGFKDLVLACHTLVFTDYELANKVLNIETSAVAVATRRLTTRGRCMLWLKRLQHLSEHGRFFAAITGFAVSGRKPLS